MIRLLLAALLLTAHPAMTSPIVQAHVNIKKVSKPRALELFGGSMRKWPDGTRIVIVIQDPDALANKFFAATIGIPHNQFSTVVNKNINDGADVRVVGNANQVLIAVAATPNSAGIYSANKYVENFDGVRLLEIEQ